MSTRTIIEINHDYLGQLTEGNLAQVVSFIVSLMSAGDPYVPQGITMLGQRHHSERLKLVLGSGVAARTKTDG